MASLDEEQIDRSLSGSPWRREEDRIERDFTFGDFSEAIAFVNRVASAAEAADHHPDILVHGWSRVRLALTTHSAGGITDLDLELARSIDGLV